MFLAILDEFDFKKTCIMERRGVSWGISELLEDLDFVNDVCPLSLTFSNKELKQRNLQNGGGRIAGLQINCEKISHSEETQKATKDSERI
jgi:hypothetical protein